jgi:hypothetical protein
MLHGIQETTFSGKHIRPRRGKPDMKTMNAKLKHNFKIGVVKMIDEILDNTESEGTIIHWVDKDVQHLR